MTDDDIRAALEAEFLGEPGKRNLADDIRVARAVIAAHEAKAAHAVPQGTNWHAHHVIVGKAALQMVRNALRNDMERGLIVRGEMLEELDKVTYSATPAAPIPAPAVPEIDYQALIRAAYAKDKKWAQGTNGCIAFARGAEWFRELMLAATPAAPSQEQVMLTDFDAIPDEVIDTAQDKSGMYRVELMRAWDAIIAALRKKEQTK